MISLKSYICEDCRDAAIRKVCQDKNINLIYFSNIAISVMKDTFIAKPVKKVNFLVINETIIDDYSLD